MHNVYVHLNEKKILICYRGTDFSDVKDILSDVQIIFGMNAIDVRIKESLTFYDQVNIKYATYKKRITGHSLGGTICYIVAKHRFPDRTITFNPGSAPNKAFLSMMQDTFFKKARTKNITTYKIFGDIVSTFSFIGNVQTFFLQTVDLKKLHTIESFPELFENISSEI
ncbi:MAG: lipase family protein [Candidatus Peribacteria bacterium]|nr:lipase family protein [Candidatus Peribacteria bacterium]